MRFLILLYGDEAAEAALSAAERREIVDQHVAFAQRLRDRGALAYSEALTPSSDAKTLRGRASGKPILTDGPFAETKEQLGGFYVVDCRDLGEALEVARNVPVSPGVAVEVRPLVEL